MTENADIDGDVFIGPSGSLLDTSSGGVSGETYYSGEDVELKEDPDVSHLTVLSSGGNLALAGNSDLTLPSGNNYRYESISVDGKATLTIEDNVELYVHNDFYLAGNNGTIFTGINVKIYIRGTGDFAGQGIMNASGVASNLQLYGLGTSNLSFTGKNDFYGTVYAPEADVYLGGNVDYFGAVFGGSVTLGGNTNFHYDEKLSYDGPFQGYDISYWQEN